MSTQSIQDAPWSPGGVAAAAAVLAQVAAAFIVLAARLPLDYTTLLAAVGAGVVAVVVLARCHLPVAIKAALVVAQVSALLMLVAARDLSGLRAVQAAAAAPALAATPPPPRVTVSGPYDPTATRAASVLSAALPQIDGGVTVVLTPAADGALDWSVRHGSERLWCGAYRESDPEAAGAFATLAERAAAAIKASGDGGLTCE